MNQNVWIGIPTRDLEYQSYCYMIHVGIDQLIAFIKTDQAPTKQAAQLLSDMLYNVGAETVLNVAKSVGDAPIVQKGDDDGFLVIGSDYNATLFLLLKTVGGYNEETNKCDIVTA